MARKTRVDTISRARLEIRLTSEELADIKEGARIAALDVANFVRSTAVVRARSLKKGSDRWPVE